MNGMEIFTRTQLYDREHAEIRLRPPAWKLLLAFDGNRNLAEVSQAIGMPLSEITFLAEEFTRKGWVEEQALTLDQYLKSNGSGTFASPPQEILDLPPAPIPPVAPPAAPVLKEPPSAAPNLPQLTILPPPLPPVLNPVSEKITPPPVPVLLPPKIISAPVKTPFVLAPKVSIPSQPVPVKKRKLRLQAVVDFLISQGETKNLGQLLVYRTFVRIPSELLDNANLAAVQLVNDPALIEDEPLQKAIIRTVEETVGTPLPDSIFVAV